jgi:enoyl-CoA hydratase/carnithine racemase
VLEIVRFAVPNPQRFVLTGRTVPPDEALAAGMIDEVVDAAALPDRAMEAAQQLAAVPRQTFRMTKQRLRAPALALMSDDASDAEALAVWCDPATHQHIRDYLARTVRKS